MSIQDEALATIRDLESRLAAALAANAKQAAESRWVAVTECVPDNKRAVLVQMVYHDAPIVTRGMYWHNGDAEWDCAWHGYGIVGAAAPVTHWREIAPPEVKP